MDLEEYVKSALLAVSRGIKAAQSQPEVGHLVGRSPSSVMPGDQLKFDGQGHLVSMLEFDVATTVEKSGGGKAEINVVGVVVGGGADISASYVSRVKFSVPFGIAAPRDQIEHANREEARFDAQIARANSRSPEWDSGY